VLITSRDSLQCGAIAGKISQQASSDMDKHTPHDFSRRDIGFDFSNKKVFEKVPRGCLLQNLGL
jgi:hypothetical protein